MADVYLDPESTRKVSVRPSEMFSAMGGVHPRNVSRTEQGSTWTLAPPRRRSLRGDAATGAAYHLPCVALLRGLFRSAGQHQRPRQ